MTISKAGVVCTFMTQVGPSFRCETVVVSRPELLGLAKMTTNKGFLCLSLISIAGIAPYCSLFPGETELVLLMKSYLGPTGKDWIHPVPAPPTCRKQNSWLFLFLPCVFHDDLSESPGWRPAPFYAVHMPCLVPPPCPILILDLVVSEKGTYGDKKELCRSNHKSLCFLTPFIPSYFIEN